MSHRRRKTESTSCSNSDGISHKKSSNGLFDPPNRLPPNVRNFHKIIFHYNIRFVGVVHNKLPVSPADVTTALMLTREPFDVTGYLWWGESKGEDGNGVGVMAPHWMIWLLGSGARFVRLYTANVLDERERGTVCKSVNRPIDHRADRRAKEWNSEWSNESVSQSIIQSVNHLIIHSVICMRSGNLFAFYYNDLKRERDIVLDMI